MRPIKLRMRASSHALQRAPLLLAFTLCAALVSVAAFPARSRSDALQAASEAKSTQTVITHVTLIDGTGSSAQADMTVIIGIGQILAVGPASRVAIPKNARVIDARGQFLIPGLWDMHVHLAGATAKPAWGKQVLLPLLIAYGITSVRDMGGDLDALQSWRKEIQSGSLPGPRMILSGPWLARSTHSSPEQIPVQTEKEARDAVDSLKQRGVDFIKILRLAPDTFAAAADEAKKQGLPFVGHVSPSMTAAQVSDAGQKSIEHIFYSMLGFDCSSREQELRQKYREAANADNAAATDAVLDEVIQSFSTEKAGQLWQKMVRDGTWEVPTLYATYVLTHPQNFSTTDPLLQYVPASIKGGPEWDRSSQPPRPPESLAFRERLFQLDRKIAASMHRAGVSILAGSDSLDPYVFVGDSLHQELAQLVEAGFTPMEALQAATRDAARFFGKLDQWGTVEIGKSADLVLLDADPLRDIHNTQKIRAVIVNGRFLDRSELDKLLSDAREAAKKN